MKNTLLALFFNFFVPGGAHLYIGDIKKAFMILPSLLFLYYISLIISMYYFNIFILSLFWILIISIYLYSFIHPVLILKQQNFTLTKSISNIYYYTFIIIYFGGPYFISEMPTLLPIKVFKITANSMSNTIIKGDTITGYKTTDIKRGDLVVFQYPKNLDIFYIKRCVGVSGDIIAMKDKNLLLHLQEGNDFIKKNYTPSEYLEFDNKLWIINPLKNNFTGIHTDSKVKKNGLNPYQLFDMLPIEIPQGEYFMIGDNRDHSNDSRFWGTVPKNNIYGKTNSIYYNFEKYNRIGMKLE